MTFTLDNPANGPTPPGPFSQVARVEIGDTTLLFVAGQVAVDEERQLIGPGDISAQSHAIMQNIREILKAHGATYADVINLRTFMTDLDQRAEAAAVRMEYVSEPYPTSTTVEVSKLFVPGALLEVEALAVTRS